MRPRNCCGHRDCECPDCGGHGMWRLPSAPRGVLNPEGRVYLMRGLRVFQRPPVTLTITPMALHRASY